MDNQYGLQPHLIERIRANVPELRTVAGFSTLAAAPDPLALLDGCFVLPTGTDDDTESRDDDGLLVRLDSIQEWQVLLAVPNRVDPAAVTGPEEHAGRYLARIRAALLGWDVPPDLGGRLHPGGVAAPIYLRDFGQYPMIFQQYIATALEAEAA